MKNAQGRIPLSLYSEAEKIVEKNNWNWSQVMRALFEKFVAEFDDKPKQTSFKLKEVSFDPESNKSAWK